jgi:membrane protease YdiL (CAAX protease family)
LTPARFRELDGPAVFVIITAVFTLIAAVLCLPLAERIDPVAGAVLRASVIYVAVIGWPPLVAVAITRRWFSELQSPPDDGIRSVPARGSMLSIAIALFVLAVAFVIELTLDQQLEEQPSVLGELSWSELLRVVIAFVIAIAILWIQAIVEELAWRGYLLPRLMRTLGPWRGLAVHGFVWGVCYAPLFAASGASIARSLDYVVTCGLLGFVLGWLRLATNSIYASAASNATLTICAGLPLLLVGQPSRFSAAFQPSGWLPLAVVVAAIAWYRPWRSAITLR